MGTTGERVSNGSQELLDDQLLELASLLLDGRLANLVYDFMDDQCWFATFTVDASKTQMSLKLELGRLL